VFGFGAILALGWPGGSSRGRWAAVVPPAQEARASIEMSLTGPPTALLTELTMQTTQRTSRLAVLSLAIALIPLFICLASSFIEYTSYPPGTSGYLDPASGSWAFQLLAPIAFSPVALLTGIIALVRISRNRPRLKGSIFAWVSLIISATALLCSLPALIVALQLLAPFFTSAP